MDDLATQRRLRRRPTALLELLTGSHPDGDRGATATRRTAARRGPATTPPGDRSNGCSTITPMSRRRWPSTASGRPAGDRGRLRRHRLRRRRRRLGRGGPGRRLPDGYDRVAHLGYVALPGWRRRGAQPLPDGPVPPAVCRGALGPTSLPCVRGLPPTTSWAARPTARDRAALRADVEHGPALRRGRLARRRLPPRRATTPRRRWSSRRSPVRTGLGRRLSASVPTRTPVRCVAAGGRRRPRRVRAGAGRGTLPGCRGRPGGRRCARRSATRPVSARSP